MSAGKRVASTVLIGFALALPGHPAALWAEVKTVELAADCADFALEPETGDLAALSAETGEAVLLRDADKQQEWGAKVHVGASPCSVFFKRFGDRRVFAVVCSQDSHMYLINAADFTLLKKVELAQSGVSHVTGSINPADPFLYYNYGSGHDSAAGVVSLRDLENHGLAFDDSMDCAISASGEVAYRRGPWSPSGFESLIRINRLADEKPVFARLFYDHSSTAQYVPDPFDRFTAAGTRIFSRSLEKNEAGLDFTPMCFFGNRPVLIGAATTNRFGPSRSGAQELILRAASYNTFSNIGEPVKLRLSKPDDEGNLPRGVPSQADFKRVRKRSRLFADDQRDRVVFASRRQLFFVPLAEFKLPDEPLLLAKLDGPQEIEMGKLNELSFVPMDDRAELLIQDVPEGIQRDGNKLRWKPTPEQIGPADLAVTLKHDAIQRTVRYRLNVVFPSVRLPFAPAALAVDTSAKRAVIWEGPKIDRYGRPTPQSTGPIRIAVLDLGTGEVMVERTLADQIGAASVSDRQVALLTTSSTHKCEVLKLGDLQREKAVVADAPIRQVSVIGGLLFLQTETGTEVYDAGTFERRKTLSTAPAARMPRGSAGSASALTEQGLVGNGVLYDFQLKPKLVFDPGELPALAGADERLRRPTSLRPLPAATARPGQFSHVRPGEPSRIATLSVPNVNVQVSLDQRIQRVQVPGSVHTWRNNLELALTASGDVDARQVIVRRQLHSATSGTPQTRVPLLQVAEGTALVVDGDQLYRWLIPSPASDSSQPSELVLTPRQSAFTLAGSGQTILEHEVRGGKKPLHFSILTPYDSITIDEATGKVTIDEKALLPEAARSLEVAITRQNRDEPYLDTLRSQAIGMMERATEILGRRPKGPPVAIPIRIDVSDSDLARQSLQYYVIAELPGAEIVERLRELDEERQQRAAEARAARAAGPTSSAPTPPEDKGDLADVKRRLESLEQRVDLMTRQLNNLIEKLEREDR